MEKQDLTTKQLKTAVASHFFNSVRGQQSSQGEINKSRA